MALHIVFMAFMLSKKGNDGTSDNVIMFFFVLTIVCFFVLHDVSQINLI